MDNFISHIHTCQNRVTCACPSVQVDEIKYLGIILDNKVTWKSHTKKLKIKLSKHLRQFYFL